MKTFDSIHAYWEFAALVQNERRWIFDGKAGRFIAAVRAAAKSRERVVKSGTRFIRAQLGSESSAWPGDKTGAEYEHPLCKDRMIPTPNHAKSGGRANPAGFAYLYLATNPETALAEMRPSLRQSITLGLFRVRKKLRIVLCKAGPDDWGDGIFGKNPSPKVRDGCVWNDIARAFSRPVNKNDKDASYVPTQIIAEAFKAEGFDGLAYDSGLARGTNVVLFDVHTAKLIRRYLYTLKKVRYEFEAEPHYQIYLTQDGCGKNLMKINAESPG
jgi:hypothetical protein